VSRRALALAAAAALPACTAACTPPLHGEDVRLIEGERHVVAWRAPEPLPLAAFFAIDFAACTRDGRRIDPPRVDATMPQHGHGMNYRPTVEARGDGRFRASGLLLHMPGRWQLSFAVGGETLRAWQVVD
jgi:hypothetical protein